MAVTWEDLKAYIGVTKATDDAFITDCFDYAVEALADVTVDAWKVIPELVYDRWTLEVGLEMWNRKKASPSGSSQYADYEGGTQPVRASRDPLSQVRTELARYVVTY